MSWKSFLILHDAIVMQSQTAFIVKSLQQYHLHDNLPNLKVVM
jgi:hypothetical protein